MLKFRKANKTDLPVLNTISVESKKHWGYPEDWIENWKEDLTLKESDLKEQIVIFSDPNVSGFYEKKGFITFGQVESYPKGRFLPIFQKN